MRFLLFTSLVSCLISSGSCVTSARQFLRFECFSKSELVTAIQYPEGWDVIKERGNDTGAGGCYFFPKDTVPLNTARPSNNPEVQAGTKEYHYCPVKIELTS